MPSVLNQDNSTARGVRTGLQTLIGLFVGLIVAVWAVPGVPDVIFKYFTDNILNAVALFGLPTVVSGIVAKVWNRARGVQ